MRQELPFPLPKQNKVGLGTAWPFKEGLLANVADFTSANQKKLCIHSVNAKLPVNGLAPLNRTLLCLEWDGSPTAGTQLCKM